MLNLRMLGHSHNDQNIDTHEQQIVMRLLKVAVVI